MAYKLNTSDGDGIFPITKFAGDIPEYIEIAAQSIYEAFHTFLRYDTTPTPVNLKGWST
jgi:hypothetical protein